MLQLSAQVVRAVCADSFYFLGDNGAGIRGAGRRASQRIYVEIEIHALEGGGGEELLAGGKEEAAHTRGAVAGGELEHEFADIHQMHARHAGAVGTHKVVRIESGVQ